MTTLTELCHCDTGAEGGFTARTRLKKMGVLLREKSFRRQERWNPAANTKTLFLSTARPVYLKLLLAIATPARAGNVTARDIQMLASSMFFHPT
jgi:hypothetical protein